MCLDKLFKTVFYDPQCCFCCLAVEISSSIFFRSLFSPLYLLFPFVFCSVRHGDSFIYHVRLELSPCLSAVSNDGTALGNSYFSDSHRHIYPIQHFQTSLQRKSKSNNSDNALGTSSIHRTEYTFKSVRVPLRVHIAFGPIHTLYLLYIYQRPLYISQSALNSIFNLIASDIQLLNSHIHQLSLTFPIVLPFIFTRTFIVLFSVVFHQYSIVKSKFEILIIFSIFTLNSVLL